MTFRLLKLPLLAFKNILSYWNPDEIFDFSLISKRTKYLTKSLTQKSTSATIFFDPKLYVRLVFQLQPYNEHCFALNDGFRHFRFSTENVIEGFLDVLKHLLNIFNASVKTIHIDAKLGEKDMNLIFKYINNLEQESILKLYYNCDKTKQIDYLLQSNKKPIEVLELYAIRDKTYVRETISDSSPIQLYKCLNTICLSDGDLLTMLNTVEMDIRKSVLTNEYLNMFLKSWTSGRTNSRLKLAFFRVKETINLRTILKGIPVVKRDPRNTKRYFETQLWGGTYSNWIFGGYDIQLSDGRTATLQWHKYKRNSDCSPVPVRWIQKYEDVNEMEDNIDFDARENRVEEPENEGEPVKEHKPYYLQMLSIIVW
ncbi:hypothetical protein GCK72_002934 [Caenorhabditis remanei]|uniref:F-box domain-containing protein n=1 Tax=Caenorhabditis remanei TaxID=31234 RepID=A0A6A5HTP8_CAERE|nr:hypothetical protein GCK72_002934 [Caenorhabditis remanei]KAF1771109.1 hypothetical protein GCK72_002934 [Caenorhabditis remanei]